MKTRTTSSRSISERDLLVEQYLPLVHHIVGRLPVSMPATLSRDDFFSVGVMGLMQAATNFDPNRGASFKTFAYTAIRGAILDEIRRHDPVPRNRRDRLRSMERATQALQAELQRPPTLEEIAERLGATVDGLDEDLLALHTHRTLSLDDHADDEGGVTLATSFAARTQGPGDSAARRETIEELTDAISQLPTTERDVVVLYYYEDLYLKEIGAILGVTESRISQILTRAIQRLHLKLRGRVD